MFIYNLILITMKMAKKLILDVDESTWKLVLKYKIDSDLSTTNETVVELIKKALKAKK